MRAIAVTLVVFYHAGIAISGGYVGVDIFFVLSGFVITLSLLRDIDVNDGIDLKRFYSRRIRRLLPALALATSVTLLLSAFVLSPFGPQGTAVSTATTASLFVANIGLYLTGGGYFSPDDAANPFLHTWSLSVEEQFYFVVPVALALTHVLAGRISRGDRSKRITSRRLMVIGIVGASVLSLLIADALVQSSTSGARLAFYVPVTRVWEFGVGTLLAFVMTRKPHASESDRGRPMLAAVVAVASGLAVLGSAFVYNDITPFPGRSALLPVLGTAGLIWSAPRLRSLSRALSVLPLRFLGDLSYSWYLWHWPFIVLSAAAWPGTNWPVFAAFFAIVPAWLSFRLLEEPIRNNRSIVGSKALLLAGICILVPMFVGAGLRIGIDSDYGLTSPSRLGELPSARANGCLVGESQLGQTEWDALGCMFEAPVGDSGLILVLGDSHASSISNGLVAAANTHGYDVAIWAGARCPYLPGLVLEELAASCRAWQDQATALLNQLSPVAVILSNRTPYYTFSNVGETPDSALVHDSAGSTTDPAVAEVWWQDQFRTLVDHVEGQGSRLLVVETIPEFDSIALPSVTHQQPDTSISIEALNDRRSRSVQLEAEVLAGDDLAALFDPATLLCDAGRCVAAEGGDVWYLDPDHLTASASAKLEPGFSVALATLLG
ncbi:MAG: peptidoglycan/LPS O-acetylase OafA/YrhL [Acidimicrobiales bacterium]|jgi:peptidoglycan/LPS O-acetylase OafA/YrhL